MLTERISSVDWVTYFTTSFVDDVASHVRLYKSAKHRLKSPLKDGEARAAGADLETTFFDFEEGISFFSYILLFEFFLSLSLLFFVFVR